MNVTEIWAKARELAETHPKAVYYGSEGSPGSACSNYEGHASYRDPDTLSEVMVGYGCIVGQAIAIVHGSVPDWLKTSDYVSEGIDTLIESDYVFEDSREHFEALGELQAAQDKGIPWGEALTVALRMLDDERKEADANH